ncbi:uncharacterized protein MONOS_4507 [Monocercomonoides exilis]|uniref:uncharacterized protein n=1 Tax=Monocercomonoides exilis TaxID=2049356 RepID=UPI0035594547|nr:hypothetical protein MONOS_4507 [Monocercomonoides exilis]|eukprot:MONOS_4507.1-p1 / transcript=MONOS_4507.1 / gene=MONOS_4507 / organism=Monocercomonoides_exilis_PA203 / gene_product=unspecified product / transcript_product=unspecified product / location=Mono_scaffold00121:3116-4615(-) / protein_length=500 / sequence_SO=supercontig / SO=protein_coding / is_pseudo=false
MSDIGTLESACKLIQSNCQQADAIRKEIFALRARIEVAQLQAAVLQELTEEEKEHVQNLQNELMLSIKDRKISKSLDSSGYLDEERISKRQKFLAEIRAGIKSLNASLYDTSTLFSSFAVPFNLYSSALLILKNDIISNKGSVFSLASSVPSLSMTMTSSNTSFPISPSIPSTIHPQANSTSYSNEQTSKDLVNAIWDCLIQKEVERAEAFFINSRFDTKSSSFNNSFISLSFVKRVITNVTSKIIQMGVLLSASIPMSALPAEYTQNPSISSHHRNEFPSSLSESTKPSEIFDAFLASSSAKASPSIPAAPLSSSTASTCSSNSSLINVPHPTLVPIMHLVNRLEHLSIQLISGLADHDGTTTTENVESTESSSSAQTFTESQKESSICPEHNLHDDEDCKQSPKSTDTFSLWDKYGVDQMWAAEALELCGVPKTAVYAAELSLLEAALSTSSSDYPLSALGFSTPQQSPLSDALFWSISSHRDHLSSIVKKLQQDFE